VDAEDLEDPGSSEDEAPLLTSGIRPYSDFNPPDRNNAGLWPPDVRELDDPVNSSAVLLADQFARFAVSRFEGAYVSDYAIRDEARWQLQTCWIPANGVDIYPQRSPQFNTLLRYARNNLGDAVLTTINAHLNENAGNLLYTNNIAPYRALIPDGDVFAAWCAELGRVFPNTSAPDGENYMDVANFVADQPPNTALGSYHRSAHHRFLAHYYYAVLENNEDGDGIVWLGDQIERLATLLNGTAAPDDPVRYFMMAVIMLCFDLFGGGPTDDAFFFRRNAGNNAVNVVACFDLENNNALGHVVRLIGSTLRHIIAATNQPCSMAVIIQNHLTAIGAVRFVESSFYQQCAKLQRDEITVGGAKTNLSDFPLFKPVHFYAKGPSVYQVATVCRLDGWGIKTAAFDRADALINHAIQKFFDMRSRTVHRDIGEQYDRMTAPYIARRDGDDNAIPPNTRGDAVGAEFMHQYVSVFRLATRILRGTRAQIGDMHARTLSRIEFDAAIDALCGQYLP